MYRRLVPRMGHNQAIGVIAHRQCRLIWLILHQGVRYEERGPAVTKQTKQRHTTEMIRELRKLGYRIETPIPKTPGPHKQHDFRPCTEFVPNSQSTQYLCCFPRFTSFFIPFVPPFRWRKVISGKRSAVARPAMVPHPVFRQITEPPTKGA